MDENKGCSGCGLSVNVGFTGLLTIVFIALKLIGIINWSWIWVLCPLWIDIVLTVLLLIGLFIYLCCVAAKDAKQYKAYRRKKDKWKF